MIDPTDKATQPLPLDEPSQRKRRGRPSTGKAMTPAEKQRAYRERQKAAQGNVTKLAPGAVLLTEAENTAIVCMLQDKAREIAVRRLSGGPVTPDQLEQQVWLSTLASKIAASSPNSHEYQGS